MSTSIVIKYSTANTEPDLNSLLEGEFAYSYASGNLFIGKADGTFEVVGGKYVSDLVLNSTRQAVPSTLVLRDSTGRVDIDSLVSDTILVFTSITGNLIGVATSAQALESNTNIAFSGDVSGNLETDFSDSSTVILSLANVDNLITGTYGGSNVIPIVTVDEKGRVVNISNAEITIASEQFANAAYTQANVASIIAQAAYNAANSQTPSFNQTSFNTANAAFALANSVSVTANTPSLIVNSALTLANASYIHANAAFDKANSQNETANTAVSAASYANSAFLTANSAFEQANLNLSQIINLGSTFSTLSNLTLDSVGNSQRALDNVDRALSYANSAFQTANHVYNVANTKLNLTGGTITGNLAVEGSLTVSGGITTIQSNQVNIGDSILNLNSDIDPLANPTENAGISIDRGLSANVAVLWNENLDRWQFTNDGTNYQDLGSESSSTYANAAYSQANSSAANAAVALTVGSYALETANIGVIGSQYANSAFIVANTPSEVANLALSLANAAFYQANSLTPVSIESTILYANLAYLQANAAFDKANTNSNNIVTLFAAANNANLAFAYANSVSTIANGSANNSNTALFYANLAFERANISTIIGLSAYAKANLTSGQDAYDKANASFDKANTVSVYANAAFEKANTLELFPVDLYARPHANAAYERANDSLNVQTGGSITGDVEVTGNLTVTGFRTNLKVSGLLVQDPVIDVSSESTGVPTQNSGIRVIRGDEVPVQIRWNEVSDVWQFTNDGVNYSNIASSASEVYSNSAYEFANTVNANSSITGVYANAAFESQNTTGVYANAAYEFANTSNTRAIISGDYANSAFLTANSFVSRTEITGIYANTAFAFANGSFSQSNTSASLATTAILTSLTADAKAVSAGSYANGAFEHANTGNTRAVIAGDYANSAYEKANSLVSGAQTANAAYTHANAAYEFANTKLAIAGGTITGSLVVDGDLTIRGDTTYANTEKVLIADNIITLNAAIDQTSSPLFDAGIEIDRGSEANVYLRYNEFFNAWQFTNDGSVYSNLSSSAAESYANSGYLHANAAYEHANASYEHANTGNTRAVIAGDYANSAFAHANTGNTRAVISGDYANSAFAYANTRFAIGGGTISGDVIVSGNLTIQGNTAEFSVPHFIVEDGILEVNSEQVGPAEPTRDAGIRVIRGDSPPVLLRWNETSDYWQFTVDGVNYSNIGSSAAETYANVSYTHANAAFVAVNISSTYANVGFAAANTANDRAVISGTYANAAYIHANSSFDRANADYIVIQRTSYSGNIANGSIWQSNTAVVTIQPSGNSSGIYGGFETPDYSSYISFNGPGERTLLSKPLNVLDSDYFVYNSIVGNNSNGGELPESGEELYLAYSTDGSSYVDIGIIHELPSNGGPIIWTNQFIEIPAEAKTKSTRFKIYQKTNNGAGEDNYGLRWSAIVSREHLLHEVIEEMIALDKSNAALTYANSTASYSNSAYIHANSAFDRANTKLAIAGGTIEGDLLVSGNLTITGNTVFHSANDFIVNDPIVLLANSNPGNLLDHGFVAHYYDGSTTRHSGFIKDVSANVWYLFENYIPHIQEEGNLLDTTHSSLVISTLKANLVSNSIISRGYELIDYINVNYQFVNSASSYANSAFESQNTTGTYANTAFERQNTTGSYANSAFSSANTAINDALAFAIALG